ncbi:MAG: phosphatase PAP2 family protein [Acidothermus sp.]|nr:phosphatase PAP2 family protein [Acidothermus sp.]
MAREEVSLPQTPSPAVTASLPSPSIRGRLYAILVALADLLRGVRRRLREHRKPRFWQELCFVVASYLVYSLIRDAVPGHITLALRHAGDILDAERAMHLNVEKSLNHLVATAHIGGLHLLAQISNYYYATMHFIVVISVLVWLYVRRPYYYRGARTAFYAANALAAVVFWLYPVAPPRLMPNGGYVDTIVVFHTWGSWGSGGVAKISNQFAAMPSLHIAWALWAGLVVWALARRWWVRALGIVYPLTTFFVIVGTANHFVLDAVGGVAVLAAGFAVQRLLSGRPVFDTLTLPLSGGKLIPGVIDGVIGPEISKQ